MFYSSFISETILASKYRATSFLTKSKIKTNVIIETFLKGIYKEINEKRTQSP